MRIDVLANDADPHGSDCVDDELDRDHAREIQRRCPGYVPPRSATSYRVEVSRRAIYLAELLDGAAAGELTAEMRDPRGLLIAVSLPTPDRARVKTIPVIAGEYKITVKNPTDRIVRFQRTSIVREAR